ncbi:hypothetical protein, partial [Dolichospermum flos-aquae]|uniref:hypothetical protein n=1 Tax=Dolichospermum flosaquae TaxID=1166 RepID=UPI00398B1500
SNPFEYSFLAGFLTSNSGNKGVVNLATERTDDLMHDFVSIITSFCARLYSIRRRTRKTECIIECLQEDECN